jgi:hypothetical protein
LLHPPQLIHTLLALEAQGARQVLVAVRVALVVLA